MPATVALLAVRVSVDPLRDVTEAGLNDAETPAGIPEAERLTD